MYEIFDHKWKEMDPECVILMSMRIRDWLIRYNLFTIYTSFCYSGHYNINYISLYKYSNAQKSL